MKIFPFLKKQSKRKVGLDIGNYYLKVAEIEKKNGSFEITALGMKDVREAQDISQAIKEVFEEAEISSKEVNIALAGENVVARHLSMPRMTEDETKKALIYELEDHIPFKPDEIYFDYHIIGEEPNAKNRMRIFLVATKKDLVEKRVELAHKAGLLPQIMTMDAIALKNTFYFNYPSKNQTNVTIINIGDKITNILIAREGFPYFVRDTHFGGDVITSLLQSKLELDKKAAQDLKHNLKDAPEDVHKIIRDSLVVLLNETFTSLDFYENLTEQKIDEIYISGGLSQLFGLKDFLSEHIGLEVINLEPFKNFSLSPRLSQEIIPQLSPYFSVAIGLALEEP